jgi:putative flavoprotein involved in K+ transport
MLSTNTVIIGGGQAGLAVSRLLTARNHDHVVLEKGRIGERWISGSWDSLRLLTPNWMIRLPYLRFAGTDPSGFLPARQVADFLRGYATNFESPVIEHATVISLQRPDERYRVETSCGTWSADNVVVATGHAAIPAIPSFDRNLASTMFQIPSAQYRNPASLPDGGVLVVGASASGVQIARELAEAGRRVLMAVGRHTRLPRRYRGLDSFWWLDRMGVLERSRDQMPDIESAEHEPSLQLSGTPGAVDLPTLQRLGVELTGRLTAVDGRQVAFRDDLDSSTADADHRLTRLLNRIDAHIEQSGLGTEIWPREPISRIRPETGPTSINLTDEGIFSVIWATGYRRTYPWLTLPVVDDRGELVHQSGVTAIPGLYVIGMPFQTRRNSSFIGGVGHDAGLIADRITGIRPSAAPVPISGVS